MLSFNTKIDFGGAEKHTHTLTLESEVSAEQSIYAYTRTFDPRVYLFKIRIELENVLILETQREVGETIVALATKP